MQWIEMIGLPGAGKSTLLRKLISLSQEENLERKWISEFELKQNFYRHIWYGRNDLLMASIRFGLLPKEVDSEELKKAGWKDFVEVHKEGINRTDFPEKSKIRLEQYYTGVIKQAYKFSKLKLHKPVFFDEGILHNNFGVIEDSFQKLIAKSPNKPVLAIYFETDRKIILSELMKEKNYDSRGMEGFEIFTEKELEEFLLIFENYTNEKVNILKDLGISVVTIRREDFDTKTRLKNIYGKINSTIRTI